MPAPTRSTLRCARRGQPNGSKESPPSCSRCGRDGVTDVEVRTDALTGAEVAVVAARQTRPNRPVDDCPFCVGGIEAPEPYVVRAFTNRWPSFPDDRCEVVLYSPEHDAALWSEG